MWGYMFPMQSKMDKINWKTEQVHHHNKSDINLHHSTNCQTISVETYWIVLPQTGLHPEKVKFVRSLSQYPSNKNRNRSIRSKNGNIGKELTVLHWNSGSKHWVNKAEEILYWLFNKKPDVYIISEANVFSTNQDAELVTPGYSMIKTKSWSTLNHSRLVVLVRENLNITTEDKLMDDKISSVWMKISGRGVKTLHIGAIYREHTILQQPIPTDSETCQLERWKHFIRQWKKANQSADCIILGDTNLDHLKWGSPDQINLNMVNLVKDQIEPLGYQQLVIGATRFWPSHRDSLLDQCWSNCINRILSVKNIPSGGSDHNLIEVKIKIKGKITSNKEVRKRIKKNWNNETYKTMIENIDWTELYASTEVSKSYGIFSENVRAVLDHLAPMRNIQLRKIFVSWISDNTKQLMKTRDSLRETACRTQLQTDWSKYKISKNLCIKNLKIDKNEHFKKVYTKMEKEKNVSAMYKTTKNQLGWMSAGTPDSFWLEGQRIRSPEKLANLQLDHFNKKIESLLSSIPNNRNDPLRLLKTAFLRWGTNSDNRPQFKLEMITESKTVDLLKQLGNSKSFGIDEIDAESLKLAASSLKKPLTFIINQSLTTCTFANQWKVSKLIPLYKGKGTDKCNPENYRPIALLSVVSKIVERTVQQQMLNFLQETKQINRNHHAYRSKHSTTTAMIQMIDKIYTATDLNQITTVMTIDESAAFDMVCHEIIIEKMRLHNFSNDTINWFSSYLHGRSQYVYIDNKSSRITGIKSGVPQGSVLGPLMYILYINELPDITKEHDTCTDNTHEKHDELFGQNCTKCGETICYADDASILYSSNSRQENQNKLEEHLNLVNNFLTDNKLVVNRDKTTITEIMIHQKRSKLRGVPPSLVVPDKRNNLKLLSAGKYTRLLGGNLSDNLCWNEQLESGDKSLLPRIRKQLGALNLLAKQLPFSSRLLLANGLLLSKMSYFIQIWGAAPISQLKKVQVILNSSARFVTGLNKRTSTQKLMTQCGWLQVEDMVKYHSLVSLWNIIHQRIPSQLHDKISITENMIVSTAAPRLLTVAHGYLCRSVAAWNSLDEDLRTIKSLPPFKRRLKSWLRNSRYPILQAEPD